MVSGAPGGFNLFTAGCCNSVVTGCKRDRSVTTHRVAIWLEARACPLPVQSLPWFAEVAHRTLGDTGASAKPTTPPRIALAGTSTTTEGKLATEEEATECVDDVSAASTSISDRANNHACTYHHCPVRVDTGPARGAASTPRASGGGVCPRPAPCDLLQATSSLGGHEPIGVPTCKVCNASARK